MNIWNFLQEKDWKKSLKYITPEIEDRFNFEIKTIKEMGFSGYFLVVAGFY